MSDNLPTNDGNGGDDRKWMDGIREKLIELYQDSDKVDGLARLLIFLDGEEKQAPSDLVPPAWKTLRAATRSDKMLKAYGDQLIKDAQTGEGDVNFRRVMNQIYESMLEVTDDAPDTTNHQKVVALRPDTAETLGFSALGALARAYEVMPVAGREAVLQLVNKYGTRALVSTVDDFVAVTSKVGGNVVMVGLAALSLGYEAIKNLRRWWKGEITGVRCAKNILDSCASVAGGLGGGMLGVAIGAAAGPFGTLAGGIIGSVTGSLAAGSIADRLTQWIFTLPKDEALEKAYLHLGVNMKATNHEINQKFRTLCLKHHPDKQGDVEEFLKVQSAMGIIKLARNDFI